MAQMTYCKRFDNFCYHHRCIANWTAVIMLQVLVGHSGETRCKNAQKTMVMAVIINCFSNKLQRSYHSKLKFARN